MSDYITGKLIRAGDYSEADASDPVSLLARVIVVMEKDVLAAVKTLPMYREVALVPVDELAKLKAASDHMAACRAEVGAPDDDVLLEVIKQLKADLAAAREENEEAKNLIAGGLSAVNDSEYGIERWSVRTSEFLNRGIRAALNAAKEKTT